NGAVDAGVARLVGGRRHARRVRAGALSGAAEGRQKRVGQPAVVLQWPQVEEGAEGQVVGAADDARAGIDADGGEVGGDARSPADGFHDIGRVRRGGAGGGVQKVVGDDRAGERGRAETG